MRPTPGGADKPLTLRTALPTLPRMARKRTPVAAVCDRPPADVVQPRRSQTAATATTVLAELPELGRISDAAAALVGVAPFLRDSGQQTGGHKPVRCARYMAALSAVHHDAIRKAFYQKLRTAGKQPKAALVACMRKLVVRMNRLLRNPKFQLAN